MLRLLGRATSGNVQKVIFGLEELGLDYEREDYGRTFGNTATDAYAAMNPTRKVPTLVDGDLVIWESHTILNPVYLAGFRDAKKPAAEHGATTASDLAAELSLLDGQLGARPWIAGEAFSLADIALGPIVRRCVAFPFDKPELPGVAAWLARLAERPAFAAAISAG
jgi:glutathione S-transferase